MPAFPRVTGCPSSIGVPSVLRWHLHDVRHDVLPWRALQSRFGVAYLARAIISKEPPAGRDMPLWISDRFMPITISRLSWRAAKF